METKKETPETLIYDHIKEEKTEENNKETEIQEQKPENQDDDEDFDLTDDLLNDVEKCRKSKLNLTEGERDDPEEDFGPEMNDMFKNVMGQFNQNMENAGNDQPENLSGMMDNMTQMLQQMMGQEGGFDPNMMNGPEGEKMMGGPDGNLDNMADNLLRQLMDKSILYEPFSQAKVELKKYIEDKKDTLSAEDLERHTKQNEKIAVILE